MIDRIGPPCSGYESGFDDFGSAFKRQVRREIYGRDMAQHSWVTAEELERHISRLALTPQSRILDLGCGACGPLTFIARSAGCNAVGVDLSQGAIQAGHSFIASQGLQESVMVAQVDLDTGLPFRSNSFDFIVSIDVIVHLRDREHLLREVARLLTPQGWLLFSDAGIVTGPVSSEEFHDRAAHGYTQFVPPGFNESLLERLGFRLLHRSDETESVSQVAAGRLRARMNHRQQFETAEGPDNFRRQVRYLETVLSLAQSKSLSRFTYIAVRNLKD